MGSALGYKTQIAPHECHCGSPAYIGLGLPECTSEDCEHYDESTAQQYREEVLQLKRCDTCESEAPCESCASSPVYRDDESSSYEWHIDSGGMVWCVPWRLDD